MVREFVSLSRYLSPIKYICCLMCIFGLNKRLIFRNNIFELVFNLWLNILKGVFEVFKLIIDGIFNLMMLFF